MKNQTTLSLLLGLFANSAIVHAAEHEADVIIYGEYLRICHRRRSGEKDGKISDHRQS